MKSKFLVSVGLLMALFTLSSFTDGPDYANTYINGHEYVDLGLSSGTKWATCNVGASKPEESGGYYAWGETEEKDDYTWETYKWCDGDEYSLTKYCTDSYYGKIDNRTVLAPEDDVVHVKWGGTWRMPTNEEIDELLKECAWEWTNRRGVNGYRVIGPNGKSIFLPAAGYRVGTEAYYRGSYGDNWSSSLSSSDSSSACCLYFDSGDYDWGGSGRCCGRSVRPVCGVTVYVGCDDGSGNSPVATINNVTSKATTLKDELQKAYDAGDSEKYVQSVASFLKEMAQMEKELSNVDPSKLPVDKLEQFMKKIEEIEKLDSLARATPGFLSQSQLDEIKKAYRSNDAVENAPATIPVASIKLENFGDFFLATADIQNRCAAKVENANDAEAIIAAVEELVNSVVELNNYVAKNVEAMAANGAPDSFGAEGQKYAAASERLRVALNNKCAQVSFTPEQEMRLGQALQRMAGAAQ